MKRVHASGQVTGRPFTEAQYRGRSALKPVVCLAALTARGARTIVRVLTIATRF